MFSELKCQQNGHFNSEVNSICMDPSCQYFRPCCLKCFQEKHLNHNRVINMNEIQNYQLKNEKDINNLIETIQQLISNMNKEIKILIDSMKFSIQKNSNLNEIHQSIQNFIKINENIYNPDNNDSPLNKLLNCSEKISTLLKQTQQISFDQKIQNLCFSQKSISKMIIKFSPNNLIVEKLNTSYPDNMFILSEYKLPMNKIKTFKIKILKQSGWIGTGIFFQSIIHQKNKINSFNFGNASSCQEGYLICSDGCQCSPLIKHKNHGLMKNFLFTENDIIETTINPLKGIIIWKKSKTGEQCQLPFEQSDDLVPGVCLQQKYDSVEIIE